MKHNVKPVEAIHSYGEIPDGTDDIVMIEDIEIPDEFKKTKCGYLKIRCAEEYYIKNGHLDKPISVVAEINERGLPNKLILVDEYSRYLAYKKLWMSHVPVKYIELI